MFGRRIPKPEDLQPVRHPMLCVGALPREDWSGPGKLQRTLSGAYAAFSDDLDRFAAILGEARQSHLSPKVLAQLGPYLRLVWLDVVARIHFRRPSEFPRVDGLRYAGRDGLLLRQHEATVSHGAGSRKPNRWAGFSAYLFLSDQHAQACRDTYAAVDFARKPILVAGLEVEPFALPPSGRIIEDGKELAFEQHFIEVEGAIFKAY